MLQVWFPFFHCNALVILIFQTRDAVDVNIGSKGLRSRVQGNCYISNNCQVIYMAHALRRISYATCDPYSSKFAFLAREANSETPCQYCHIFATDSQYKVRRLFANADVLYGYCNNEIILNPHENLCPTLPRR